MRPQIVVLGDNITIQVIIPEAKAGEIYRATTSIEKPDGTIHSYDAVYKFVKPLKRRKIS